MTVIIGGMGLSGSTLCYNIFRIIAERKDIRLPKKYMNGIFRQTMVKPFLWLEI